MKLILVGGFLGSGKTTAIKQACSLLLKKNKTVAVITNDQGEELVDSKFIQNFSIPVKEVTKGCFCCNYDALLDNIYYFSEQVNPDIIFAESVGSCTDIVATIVRPIAEMHPELILNISVFVDAYLLHSLITGTSSFIDDSVRYIFKKQMEEADILILNKTDLLTDQQLKEVQLTINRDYSSKQVLQQNSLDEKDVKQWIDSFEKDISAQRTSLNIDYNIYGEGEAKLAWLDAVLFFRTEKIPALKAAALLAETMYKEIKQKELTVGHLKFLINDGKEQHKISYTTSDQQRQFILSGSSSAKASVIINARVQTEPEMLQQIIFESIEETSLKANCKIQVQSLSAFKPGFPRPTHRIAD
jgi:G3E family GTPase